MNVFFQWINKEQKETKKYELSGESLCKNENKI